MKLSQYRLPDDSKADESKADESEEGSRMITMMWIILADIVVAAIFIYYYRQELGLTSGGSNDGPTYRNQTAAQRSPRMY